MHGPGSREPATEPEPAVAAATAVPLALAPALSLLPRGVGNRAVARFVGPAQPFRATLFDKSASANWLVVWHQDTALPMRAPLS